jgi:hypothetical protein
VLLAALIAHGTNLGISAMGHSAEGITLDLLRNASQWFLNEETRSEHLKKAFKSLHYWRHQAIWNSLPGVTPVSRYRIPVHS